MVDSIFPRQQNNSPRIAQNETKQNNIAPLDNNYFSTLYSEQSQIFQSNWDVKFESLSSLKQYYYPSEKSFLHSTIETKNPLDRYETNFKLFENDDKLRRNYLTYCVLPQLSPSKFRLSYHCSRESWDTLIFNKFPSFFSESRSINEEDVPYTHSNASFISFLRAAPMHRNQLWDRLRGKVITKSVQNILKKIYKNNTQLFYEDLKALQDNYLKDEEIKDALIIKLKESFVDLFPEAIQLTVTHRRPDVSVSASSVNRKPNSTADYTEFWQQKWNESKKSTVMHSPENWQEWNKTEIRDLKHFKFYCLLNENFNTLFKQNLFKNEYNVCVALDNFNQLIQSLVRISYWEKTVTAVYINEIKNLLNTCSNIEQQSKILVLIKKINDYLVDNLEVASLTKVIYLNPPGLIFIEGNINNRGNGIYTFLTVPSEFSFFRKIFTITSTNDVGYEKLKEKYLKEIADHEEAMNSSPQIIQINFSAHSAQKVAVLDVAAPSSIPTPIDIPSSNSTIASTELSVSTTSSTAASTELSVSTTSSTAASTELSVSTTSSAVIHTPQNLNHLNLGSCPRPKDFIFQKVLLLDKFNNHLNISFRNQKKLRTALERFKLLIESIINQESKITSLQNYLIQVIDLLNTCNKEEDRQNILQLIEETHIFLNKIGINNEHNIQIDVVTFIKSREQTIEGFVFVENGKYTVLNTQKKFMLFKKFVIINFDNYEIYKKNYTEKKAKNLIIFKEPQRIALY